VAHGQHATSTRYVYLRTKILIPALEEPTIPHRFSILYARWEKALRRAVSTPVLIDGAFLDILGADRTELLILETQARNRFAKQRFQAQGRLHGLKQERRSLLQDRARLWDEWKAMRRAVTLFWTQTILNANSPPTSDNPWVRDNYAMWSANGTLSKAETMISVCNAQAYPFSAAERFIHDREDMMHTEIAALTAQVKESEEWLQAVVDLEREWVETHRAAVKEIEKWQKRLPAPYLTVPKVQVWRRQTLPRW
jgi:hypothetical protein